MTATLAWVDAIIWSEDNVTDSTDTLLTTVDYDADGLVPNSAYSVVQTVTIPRYISGDYWVFVEVDYQNTVYEHFDEDNNIRRAMVK